MVHDLLDADSVMVAKVPLSVPSALYQYDTMVQFVVPEPLSTRLMRVKLAGTPEMVPVLPMRNPAEQIQMSPAVGVAGVAKETVVDADDVLLVPLT